MNSYSWSAAFALLCFVLLLAWLGRLMWLNRRARIEAESAESRDRDHFLLCVGFNDAYVLGLLGDPAQFDPRAREDAQ